MIIYLLIIVFFASIFSGMAYLATKFSPELKAQHTYFQRFIMVNIAWCCIWHKVHHSIIDLSIEKDLKIGLRETSKAIHKSLFTGLCMNEHDSYVFVCKELKVNK